ncbi:UbiA prenyltransferase family [Schizophyllum commune]
MSSSSRNFIASSLTRGIYTIYLFTETDIVPFLCPALAMGVVLAGPPDALALVEGITKNQLLGLQEDRISKPHRPLAAGRISPEATRVLHFAFVAASLALSAYRGLLPCSALYFAATYAYNEGGLARIGVLKSALSAVGYVCYGWGMIDDDHGRPLSPLARSALAMTGAVFATTDFRDRAGDAVVGRKTIPLILSHGLARWLLGVSLFGWTAALVYFWEPPAAFSLLLGGLALTSAMLFVRGCTEAADARAYWWYSLWLIACHVLPIFPRLRGAVDT